MLTLPHEHLYADGIGETGHPSREVEEVNMSENWSKSDTNAKPELDRVSCGKEGLCAGATVVVISSPDVAILQLIKIAT